MAYRGVPRLIITADLQRTNWSEYDIDVEYDTPASALTNKDYSGDWHDSNRYRCGAEFSALDCLKLRAGYMFDESPLPDKSVSLSNIVGVDRHNVTLGAGYGKKDGHWTVDVIYGLAWGERNINGLDFSQLTHALGMSSSYMF